MSRAASRASALLASAGAAGRRRHPGGAHMAAQAAQPAAADYLFNDSHFHLTNYVQKGTDIHRVPGDHGRQGRALDTVRHPAAAAVVVREFGDYAPTYYLQSDAPLYYYSFTDA